MSVLHKGGTTAFDGASYTYDNAGNRTSKTNYLNNITESYTYDPIYQLAQVTQGATTTESYSYDSVGNRVSSLGISPYTYNSSNELTSTPAATYTYDANGNTLTKTDSSGTKTYNWDFENRLASVVLPGTGGTVAFKYDPFGRRVQKASQNSTKDYPYDDISAVGELDMAGNWVGRYVQNVRVDEPLAEERNSTVAFVEQDDLNSVTSLTDLSGNGVNTYTYSPFGELLASSGAFDNPLQFGSRDFDVETGLRYYRARYYDSQDGRSLTEDPLALEGDEINFYVYADQNPIDFVDRTGEQAEPKIAPAPKPFLVPKPVQVPKPKLPSPIESGWWMIFWDLNAGNDPWALHCIDVADPVHCKNGKPFARTPQPDGAAAPAPTPAPRTIPKPDCPKRGCTCTCRADADDTMPGNVQPGLPLFAFGTATAENCAEASKAAKRIATHALRMKPKHIPCKCEGK